MNVETGELIRLMGNNQTTSPNNLSKFIAVPNEFENEANSIIEKAEAEGKAAFADMESDTPLVNWAKRQQAKQSKKKQKNKKRTAKSSRAKNRR